VGWGCDIVNASSNPSTRQPKPDIVKNDGFRLEFTRVFNPGFHSAQPLPPPPSVVGLVVDYLSKMRESMWEHIRIDHNLDIPNCFEDIDCCFAVSPSWEGSAKSEFMSAIMETGLVRPNSDRAYLISDAHAAAAYCFSTNIIKEEEGAVVLVIDCGGCMTQLIALRLEDAESMEFSECTSPSSDSCGSQAVDRNFTNIIRSKVRKMNLSKDGNFAGKLYWKSCGEFESRIKGDFTNSGQDWKIHIGTGSDCPEVGFVDEYITFTNEEILQCFDPVVNGVIDLMNKQATAIEAQYLKLEVFKAC
jgi:hypothetical protein